MRVLDFVLGPVERHADRCVEWRQCVFKDGREVVLCLNPVEAAAHGLGWEAITVPALMGEIKGDEETYTITYGAIKWIKCAS